MTQHNYQVGDLVQFNERGRSEIITGHYWPYLDEFPLETRKKLAKGYYPITRVLLIGNGPLYVVRVEHAVFNFDISSYFLEPVSPLVTLALAVKEQNDAT